MPHPDDLTDAQRTELDAAAFRRLLAHLDDHKEVQNIDLMLLADFCRNCLGDWWLEAVAERGFELSRADARARVYGMDPDAWKAQHQTETSPEKLEAFKAKQAAKAGG
ncbi:DUF1244 domain-containing protein [Maricaulis sp.]|uniref:DUF1244 domain-containing protein n=1 Tax=Maricaulis sp. TaxID=1486257 RepID=UPI003519BC05